MTGRFAAWRGAQGLAALGILLVTAVVRGWLLAGSYFNQDDFYMTGRAAESDLTLDYLTRDFAGHVNPLQQLTLWLVAHGAPYRWPVLVVGILLVNLLAVVLMWLILTRLLPGRWARVGLLAVFAWTPLTLVSTLWWSASMFLWPHVVCSLAAVWLLVRWKQEGRPVRHLLAILLVTAIGLLWHERAVLIPPLVFGVAVALADRATGWRKVTAALRDHAWLWGSMVALLGGFLFAHSRLTEVVGGETDADKLLGVTWSFLGRSAVPGLAGGPWTGEVNGGAVVPATWVTVVSLLLAALVLVLLLRGGGPARRWALAVLLGYVAADTALLLSGRAAFGSVIGLDPRYSADIPHAAVLCAALALRGGPAGLGLARLADLRRRRVVVAGLVAAYAVAAGFGTALLVPHFQNKDDRAFVEAYRGDLALDPTVVVFDELAPAELVLPLVGDDSRFSHIFGPLPENPAFDEPSPRLRMIGPDGHLRPLVFDGTVDAPPGPDGDCGYEITGIRKDVPFVLPVEGRLALRVQYYTQAEATVTVEAGDWSDEFLARRGPNEVWLVLPDLPGTVPSVDLTSDGDEPVCVTDVAVGLPVQP
ncbi:MULTISPECIES: hypothetical protein [unclassified Nocardioides]|uniref:hypothetical protein n=1 Tax=unclassified Nocardioides TaxID=2615069 RepID=UPI0007029FAD|nr:MULTISPECIES: hypothetical protein [unclassified Nocardioides]KRC56630.1 hypothetical protein ASE19_02000 [Nocardioides sp. Root79]KRC76841.1 hypothetical protein ASE20_00870 [Nocardioides sp. Root240]